jgi:hypothetical protein
MRKSGGRACGAPPHHSSTCTPSGYEYLFTRPHRSSPHWCPLCGLLFRNRLGTADFPEKLEFHVNLIFRPGGGGKPARRERACRPAAGRATGRKLLQGARLAPPPAADLQPETEKAAKKNQSYQAPGLPLL